MIVRYKNAVFATYIEIDTYFIYKLMSLSLCYSDYKAI